MAVRISRAAAHLENMSEYHTATKKSICVYCGAVIQRTGPGDAAVTGWSDKADGTDILGSGLLCPNRNSPPDMLGCRGHEPEQTETNRAGG